MPPAQRAAFLESLSADEARVIHRDWHAWARPEQLAPDGAWRIWLFLGGRGAGKTRAGAEWILQGVREGRMRRIALLGATYADVRDVMILGESGLLPLARSEGAVFEPSKRRLHWPGGAEAHLFSAEEPDGLRGHQFDGALCDEYAKWREPQAALDMLLMALRVGADLRQCRQSGARLHRADAAPLWRHAARAAGIGRQADRGQRVRPRPRRAARRRQQNAVTWLGLLKAALLAMGAFAAWLKDRRLIEAGRAEIIAQNLKAALDEIAKAHLARDAVRYALERDPDRLRDDDGFRRPD